MSAATYRQKALNFHSSAAPRSGVPAPQQGNRTMVRPLSVKRKIVPVCSRSTRWITAGIVASGFGLAGSETLTTSYCVSPAAAVELFEETMRTPFDP